MLDVGVPEQAVRLKMQLQGLDDSVLDDVDWVFRPPNSSHLFETWRLASHCDEMFFILSLKPDDARAHATDWFHAPSLA